MSDVSCHGAGSQEPHSQNHGSGSGQRGSRTLLWVAGLGLLAVAALWLYQTGRTNLLGYGLLLLCPAMHLFMVGGHGQQQHTAPPPRGSAEDKRGA